MGSLRDAVKRGVFHKRLSETTIAVDMQRVLQVSKEWVGAEEQMWLLHSTALCPHHPRKLPNPSHIHAPTPQVLLEIARSVEYLHERKLLHCDLKVGLTYRGLGGWGWGVGGWGLTLQDSFLAGSEIMFLPSPSSPTPAQLDNVLLKTDTTHANGFASKLVCDCLGQRLFVGWIWLAYASFLLLSGWCSSRCFKSQGTVSVH